MTREQAEEKIKQAGGDVSVFWKWIKIKTCGLIDEEELEDFYDYGSDVDDFIKFKCDPRNDPKMRRRWIE